MAKMTKEQKAEQARLKAIPNDGLKESIKLLNAALKEAGLDEIQIDKTKGGTVANLTDTVQTLVNEEKHEIIPESVVEFFNKHIVGEESDESSSADESSGEKDTKDGKKKSGKKDTKDGKKKSGPRKTKEEIQARYDAISAMIAEGKHTKPEIVKAIAPKFPDVKEVTIATFVQDCMNPKYNKLPKLTVKDDKGILSFEK